MFEPYKLIHKKNHFDGFFQECHETYPRNLPKLVSSHLKYISTIAQWY